MVYQHAPRVTAHPLRRAGGQVVFSLFLYDGYRIVSPPLGVEFTRAELARSLNDLDNVLRTAR